MDISDKPLLSIRNLTIEEISTKKSADTDRYKTVHNHTILLHQFNLDVHLKECVALIGTSASGKTLVALSILRQIKNPNIKIVSGEIIFDGIDLLTLDDSAFEKTVLKKIGIVYQEPSSALNPHETIQKQLKKALRLHSKVRFLKQTKLILSLLKRVGLSDAEHKLNCFPSQLSRGECQLITFAMTILKRPTLLIVDELLEVFDGLTQGHIISLLNQLKSDIGMSILLLSNNIFLTKHTSERIVIIDHGETIEYGSRYQIYLKPKEEYTKQLLEISSLGDPVNLPIDATPLLSVKELTVEQKHKINWWKSVKKIRVNQFNVDINQGESIGIIGEIGSGKTSIALAILNLINSTGQTEFEGASLSNLSERELLPLKNKIQIVFQSSIARLNPKLTVFEAIDETLSNHSSLNKTDREQKILNLMFDLGFTSDYREHCLDDLSTGQLQSVALARAIILEPKLILLDDPTSSLDPNIKSHLVDALRKLQLKYHISYLIISHDLPTIYALCNKVIVMKKGNMIECEHRDDLFNHPKHPHTQSLINEFDRYSLNGKFFNHNKQFNRNKDSELRYALVMGKKK